MFGSKKPTKKIDAIVTGVILGTTIATIYGLKKRREREKKEATETIEAPKKPSFASRIVEALKTRFSR